MSPDRVAAWLTPCCGDCKRNKSIKKRGTGVLRFSVRSLEPPGRLRLPQDIVDAHVVKIRQLDEDVGGELLLTGLHIAVFPLRYAYCVGHLLLRQIVILPQIADPIFHTANHPLKKFALIVVQINIIY